MVSIVPIVPTVLKVLGLSEYWIVRVVITLNIGRHQGLIKFEKVRNNCTFIRHLLQAQTPNLKAEISNDIHDI